MNDVLELLWEDMDFERISKKQQEKNQRSELSPKRQGAHMNDYYSHLHSFAGQPMSREG